jgi:hypothetical protein
MKFLESWWNFQEQYFDFVQFWCMSLTFTFIKLSMKFQLILCFVNFGHIGWWWWRKVKFLISQLPSDWWHFYNGRLQPYSQILDSGEETTMEKRPSNVAWSFCSWLFLDQSLIFVSKAGAYNDTSAFRLLALLTNERLGFRKLPGALTLA